MSQWKEAIADVVKDLREEADDYINGLEKETPQQATYLSYLVKTLRGYAKRLEGICKASPDPTPPMQMQPGLAPMGVMPSLISPTIQHVAEIEKFRGEFKKHKSGSDIEERHDGDMVLIVGGPAAPDDQPSYHPMDPRMPFGAYALLAGGVYRLELGTDMQKQLVFDEEQTKGASGQAQAQKEEKKEIILG